MEQEAQLTHIDAQGNARMVDVSEKDQTQRIAIAYGEIHMAQETMRAIQAHQLKKGDVLTVAQVAGIMGAKRTPDLIPMCHTLLLTGVDVTFTLHEGEDPFVAIEAKAKLVGKTGVEMEALTAASVAALTIYDMCKAIDKSMYITNLYLQEKTGGKSGDVHNEHPRRRA